MINNVTLVGRLTRDIELKHTQSGVAVTSFTLAVNRPFKNQQGENEADFINCVAWRKQAENAARFLGKGSLIGIEGRIETRNYDDKDGKRVFVTEVVADRIQFLETKNSNSVQNTPSQQYQNNVEQTYPKDPFGPIQRPSGTVDVSDGDLPF